MSAIRKGVEMNAISFVLQFRLIAGAHGELGIAICALP